MAHSPRGLILLRLLSYALGGWVAVLALSTVAQMVLSAQEARCCDDSASLRKRLLRQRTVQRLTLAPEGPVRAVKVHHIKDSEQILPSSSVPAGTPANLLCCQGAPAEAGNRAACAPGS